MDIDGLGGSGVRTRVRDVIEPLAGVRPPLPKRLNAREARQFCVGLCVKGH